MSNLLLLAAFASLWFVLRREIDRAILWVYLPCLIALPQTYHIQIPHLPQFPVAQLALMPVGAVAFFQWVRGPFRRMDLWVVMSMISVALTEVLREPKMMDGILYAIIYIEGSFLSYLVGRTLLEPGLRVPVLKQCLLACFIQLPLLAWEARMGTSLYDMFASRFLHIYDFGWFVQIRGGHARISGAFSDAELAGIAFAAFFTLNMWLIKINRTDLKSGRLPRLGEFFSKLERYWIPGWILLGLLFLTRSRGPILGLAAGLLVLQIGRFEKKRKFATVAVAVAVVAGMMVAYQYFASYASGPAQNEEQGSAAYRFELLQSYAPVIEQGGWLGWGVLYHPVRGGQRSIDNEYLLVHVCYGTLGMICFYLVVFESIFYQCGRVWRLRNKEDFLFAVSMLATLVVIWLTIVTVYLGEQLPMLTFLLVGWGQSITESTTGVPGGSTVVAKAEQTQYVRVFS